eukprot:m.76533 g.76533  ORF g.76533 m.76533 type:complete len:341 (-) comp14031_c0_seq1:215-1237(-)
MPTYPYVQDLVDVLEAAIPLLERYTDRVALDDRHTDELKLAANSCLQYLDTIYRCFESLETYCNAASEANGDIINSLINVVYSNLHQDARKLLQPETITVGLPSLLTALQDNFEDLLTYVEYIRDTYYSWTYPVATASTSSSSSTGSGSVMNLNTVAATLLSALAVPATTQDATVDTTWRDALRARRREVLLAKAGKLGQEQEGEGTGTPSSKKAKAINPFLDAEKRAERRRFLRAERASRLTTATTTTSATETPSTSTSLTSSAPATATTTLLTTVDHEVFFNTMQDGINYRLFDTVFAMYVAVTSEDVSSMDTLHTSRARMMFLNDQLFAVLPPPAAA